jgi:hypothetical protein
MSDGVSGYRRPWWYRGRHLQTLWGPLLRPGRCPRFRRERIETPDGDFVDLDWLGSPVADAPLVLILHGLEGSSRSHYVAGLCREVAALRLRAVVMNFRSCSGELNRTPRLYHSGETSDLDLVLRRLLDREAGASIGVVGISLGGNVALKWLGEQGDGAPAPVRAAVAISTPFELAECARMLDAGLPRLLYTENFLRTMKPKVHAKARLLDGRLDLAAVRRARTFTEYDRAVTAPIFGFADERDYWARSSSRPFLPKIRRPTLLINAVNDPFIPPSALPEAEVAASAWLEAAFAPEGGHAGFLEGPWGHRSWAERRALTFLHDHLLPRRGGSNA